MQFLAAALTAGFSGKWIPLAIVAAACVLAAELICVVVLLTRISRARKAERREDHFSANFLLPLMGVSLLPAELVLLVLVIAVLVMAAVIAGILVFARVNGYDFMPMSILPVQEPERLSDQPVSADQSQTLDDAVATFAEEPSDTSYESAPYSDEGEPTEDADADADEPAEGSTAIVAQEPTVAEGTSAAPAERIVERYVTETVHEREVVRESGSDELYRAINTLSDLLADERRRSQDPEEDDEPDEEETPEDETDSEEGEDTFEEAEENEPEDSGAFTGNERIVGFDEESGCYIVATYRKSFEAKLIQASPFIKKCYSQLKNALLAYKGTKSRISWSCDSYTNERTAIAKINVKSHILELYLALDPESLEDTVYHGTDVSDKKKYEDTPFRYKLRTPRKLQWALELVERVCVEQGLSPIDAEEVDYEQLYPFDTTENLVERKLIKETRRLEQKSTTFELDEDHVPDLPQEDPSVIPANANFSWEFDEEAMSAKPEEEETPAQEEGSLEEPIAEGSEPETTAESTETPENEYTVSEKVHIMQRRVTEHYYANGERDRVEEVITTDAPMSDVGELPSVGAEYEETPVEEPNQSEEVPVEEPAEVPMPEIEEVPEKPSEDEGGLEQLFEEDYTEPEDSVPAFGASYEDTRYADVRHTNPYRDRSVYEEEPEEQGSANDPYEETQPVGSVEEEPEPAYGSVEQPYEAEEPVYEEPEPEPEPEPQPKATPPKTNLNAATVDVRTLELNFAYGSTVNLKTLKEKGLVLQNATTLKIVASTEMTKAMTVEANQFSLDAIRVITEAGGETVWIQ